MYDDICFQGRADVPRVAFSLSGCGSVLYSHPKAILSGRGIIGGRHGRQSYPGILSTGILNGQPEDFMDTSIITADFDNSRLWLQLSDGRTLGVPLAYFPRLEGATPEQRSRFELSPRGIHWDELDEDLSLEGCLVTRPLQTVRSRPIKKA